MTFHLLWMWENIQKHVYHNAWSLTSISITIWLWHQLLISEIFNQNRPPLKTFCYWWTWPGQITPCIIMYPCAFETFLDKMHCQKWLSTYSTPDATLVIYLSIKTELPWIIKHTGHVLYDLFYTPRLFTMRIYRCVT